MSIKSDNWIRRMAQEHGMIEPFAPEQVRLAEDGRKIVSYGTSSYGYDVRCANEFKIFTNINTTIVDPKKFDEKSFVDVRGDVCIIPPNSFALARTIEYFRIPRNVLVVCLGKCVTGDTRVVDADTGAYIPITQMRWGRTTLGLDGWKLAPGKVSAFVPQGVRPVFELRTKAGLRIRATANHPFRMLHGWMPLENLRPGDRIAAARSIPVFGKTSIPDWEASLLGLTISEGQCDSPGHGRPLSTTDPVLVRLLESVMQASGLGASTDRSRCGHSLFSRTGRAGIPEGSPAHRWLKRHGLDVGAGNECVPQAIFMAPRTSVRLFLQALFSGDGGMYWAGAGGYLGYRSGSRRLIEDLHHLLLRFGVFSLIRETTTPGGTRACEIRIADPGQIARFADEIGFVPGCIRHQRLEAEVLPALRARAGLRSDSDILRCEVWPMLAVAGCAAGGSVGPLGVHTASRHSVPHVLVEHAVSATRDDHPQPLLDAPVWDVVDDIVPAGHEEVYDITVVRLHNFVANDLIVHNSTYARCGIIVNVTPLEPEWEGHVTLEFSNTTPLPAKIYANEGVAQMLFFESDEVCATSYRDRGGKYMGQRGVTLPKT